MSKLKNELSLLRDENNSLRDDIKKMREDYALYHISLAEIITLSSSSPTINDIARKALASTGTLGCPAGPIGVNGLTQEEIEGSDDE